jgi:S1-C subfamily serine protease
MRFLSRHYSLILIVVLIMLFYFVASANAPVTNVLPLATEMLKSIVQVSTDKAVGSGIIIDSQHILTAAHVVCGSNIATIKLFDSKVILLQATIVRRDEKLDLALLKIKGQLKNQVELYRKKYKLNLLCYAVGCPLGERTIVTKGHVCDIGPIYILATANIIAGNSGGALFIVGADGKIYLAGITVRVSKYRFQVVPYLGWHVRVELIAKFLKGAECEKQGVENLKN